MRRTIAVWLALFPLAGAYAQERKAPFLQGVSVFAGGAWSRYSGVPAVATFPELGPFMGNRAGGAVGLLWEYRFGDHFLSWTTDCNTPERGRWSTGNIGTNLSAFGNTIST